VNILFDQRQDALSGFGSCDAARRGLTAFVAASPAKYADKNITINTLLPGIFDNPRACAAGFPSVAKKTVQPESALGSRR